MNIKHVYIIAFALLASSCNRNKNDFDASGTFEADEVVVSAGIGGRILSFNVNEGETIPPEKIVGLIDVVELSCSPVKSPRVSRRPSREDCSSIVR